MLFIPQIHIQIVAITCTIILVTTLIIKIYRRGHLDRSCSKELNIIQFSIIDLGVGLYLLWGLCILLFLSEPPAESTPTQTVSSWLSLHGILLWKWLTLALVYVWIRSISKKEWIFGIIVIVGVLQATWVLGQQIGYLESNHSLFPITGLLGNPGQLGGFQAVTFVSALLLLTEKFSRRKEKESPKYGFRVLVFSLSGAVLLIAYSLYLTNSRAALIAVIAGSIVLCQETMIRMFRKWKWMYFPAILLIAGMALAIYGYRRESADARLLIWRISGDMIAQKPLWGHGIGSFNDQYMLYQARYFEQHSGSDLAMVADNVAYPYNEFLHILIEQGMIGLLLFIALIAATIITATKKKKLAPLVALLLFSCFSYPADVFWLLIFFPLLFACIESKIIYTASLRLWGLIAIPVLFLIGILSVQEMQFYRKTDKNIRILSTKYDKTAVEYLSNHFDKLSRIRSFNTQFIIWMPHCHEIVDERKFQKIMPNCENWCDIGDYYASKKDFDRAELYYYVASQMIPTRLKPNYQLWLLYLEKGDSLATRQIANRLLNQPLKVENTFTLRAKATVKRYYLQP